MRSRMHYFEINAMAHWGFLRFKAVPTVEVMLFIQCLRVPSEN